MGRPRTVSDDEILDATREVVGRAGPGGLTLAAVARESGLSPSALVQRFGSKRGLLLAFAQRGASVPPAMGGDVVEGLVAHAAGVADPDALVHHLALLQEELSDPERRAIVAEHARRVLDALADAVDAATARRLYTTYNGSLITWAMFREGDLADWLRRDLRAALGGGADG